MELAEQDFKVFEDFLAFLQSHPEIEKCEPDKELIISLSDFEIHLSKRKVFRNQQEISLTKTEYEILLCLIHNANRVLTHSQIYEKVWRELDYGMAQKLVTHHVQAIRRKLNFGKELQRPSALHSECRILFGKIIAAACANRLLLSSTLSP